MSKHEVIETRSALPLETRSDENTDPVELATRAVEELRTAAEERATAHTNEVRALNERIATMETRLNRPNIQTEQREERTDHERAFETYLRRGDAGLGEVERRALTVGNDASAGFLAPPTFGDEILKKLVEFSPLRSYAKVVTISGRDITYPRRVSGTNAQWVGEIDLRPESSLVYEQVTLVPHELATFVEISKKLLEDSAYDVEEEVRSAFAEDIAAKEAASFVAGDGVNKPKGVLLDTGIQTVVSGAAASLGTAPGDLLIDMMAKLPSVYAQNGAWAMNRTSLATIQKLKDSQGNYLWQPGLQAGQPSTILGRPVIEMLDFANIGAGAFPIVFGDWSGYRIVDRVDTSVLVDPFTRAKNGITVMHCRKRVGGAVTNPDRFVKLKVATA